MLYTRIDVLSGWVSEEEQNLIAVEFWVQPGVILGEMYFSSPFVHLIAVFGTTAFSGSVGSESEMN